MAWNVYGEVHLTADMSSPTYTQRIIPNSDVVLLACRVWLVLFNDPVFTDIGMKIYSNDADDMPKKLLHTSSSTVLKTTITSQFTEDYVLCEIPIEWDYVPLKGTDTYHFALYANGYTGTSASHIAWKLTFPDPPYRTNLDLSFEALLLNPYNITFVGAPL